MRAWPVPLAVALCLALAPGSASAAGKDDGKDASTTGTRTVKAATGETLALDYVLNEPWVGVPKRMGVRLTDKAGAPLANKLILMKVTGANPTDGYLDAFTAVDGTTEFSVTPSVPGTDLFTVCWDDEYLQQTAPDCTADTTANVTLTWTQPAFIAEPSAATEGDKNLAKMRFAVRLLGDSAGTETVKFETKDGTAKAGLDYRPASGTLRFAPGEQLKTVEVDVLPDTIDEVTESFGLRLFDAVDAAISGNGVGQINDNDRVPALSIDDVEVFEPRSGTSDAVLTVNLSAPSGRAVSVDYATVAGSASPGSDYAATNGTLTFAPGDTRATLTIPVVADTVQEAAETFQVTLSAPTNATLQDGIGEVTISERAVPSPRRSVPPPAGVQQPTPPAGGTPTGPTRRRPAEPPAQPRDDDDPCGTVTDRPHC